MKFQKIIFSLVFVSFVFIGCKNEDKKETTTDTKEIVSANTEELAINISGMTCEVGCAKYIQSKLSKEDGVINANVVFKDSTATVKYDTSKTNKASLISLVNGLADNMYTATEGKSCAGKKASCSGAKKEDCCKGEKACDKDKKTSCTHTKKNCSKGEKSCAKDKSCASSCEKKGCKTKEAKACDSTCEKVCCDAKDVKSCTGNSKETCCANKEGKSCTASVEDKKSCSTDCKKSCCA